LPTYRISKTVRDDVRGVFHAQSAIFGMSVVLVFEGERHQQSTVALRTRRYRFKLDPHLDDSLFELRDEIIGF
jgi:hypothetical protein